MKSIAAGPLSMWRERYTHFSGTNKHREDETSIVQHRSAIDPPTALRAPDLAKVAAKQIFWMPFRREEQKPPNPG